jgi:HD-GYP domain-containing protein (c-di-GMP phosphodiesterase class II)
MVNKKSIEVSVNDLQCGMYVSELDRPWLETPYLIQGILIQSQSDIDVLKRYCVHVHIDIDKSEPFVVQQLIPHTASDIAPNIDRENNKLKSTKAHEALSTFFQHLETYTDACTAKEETPAATKAYNIASTLFSDININIERNLKVDIRAAHEVVDTLCASVVRNPDAALLLAQLKTTGKELYDNAIKTSVHLLAFGRHIGLPRKELSILGLGGLLMDIGKLRLPKDIQTKSSLFLKPAERKLIKQHVCYGEEIIAQSTDIPEEVSKIIAQHHERENGSGYPHGLYANKLHAYGRMAAIVDCYEELIAPQPGMPSLRPFQALKELRDNSNSGLNYTLVEQFTQCIGMFPVGSLVELNTGEVAIVLTHNRTQRFLPSVMIICDAQKKPYDTPITLDLRTTAPGPGGVQYTITRDLPQGAYGIDAKQYYL